MTFAAVTRLPDMRAGPPAAGARCAHTSRHAFSYGWARLPAVRWDEFRVDIGDHPDVARFEKAVGSSWSATTAVRQVRLQDMGVEMTGARRWAAGAAAFYVLWGLLHMGLGVSMVIGDLADGAPDTELAAESLMFFICATVLGAQAIFVALTMNRVNSRIGYWLNVAVLGVVDVAFLVFLVVPGHVDLIGGTSGPAIWLMATVCATVALRREPVSTSSTIVERSGDSVAERNALSWR